MSKKDITQLIGRIRRDGGFTVAIDGGDHWRVTNKATREWRTLPRTPSEYRGYQNCLRDLRQIDYHDQRRKTSRRKRRHHVPAASEVLTITNIGKTSVREPPDVITDVRAASRFLWEVLREIAKHNDPQGTTHEGARGYVWVGRLSETVPALWPQDLAKLDKKTLSYRIGRLRELLTSAGNIVVLRIGNPSVPSRLFIRADWVEPRPVAPIGRPKRAVKAAPAGEPAPAPAPAPASAPVCAPTSDGKTPHLTVEQFLAFLAEHDALVQQRSQILDCLATMATALDTAKQAFEKIRATMGNERS